MGRPDFEFSAKYLNPKSSPPLGVFSGT